MAGESRRGGRPKSSLTLELNVDFAGILVFALILFYALAQLKVLSLFEGLPSPFYGGDLYHQLGSVYHISQSGLAGWFTSSTFVGELPHYFPLYGIYVSLFVWFLGVTPLKALLFSSIVSSVLVISVVYFILKRVFGDGLSAAAGVFLFFPLTALPILKYTNFAMYFMTPVFAYLLYVFFFREAGRRNALLLGLFFGLYSLTHGTGFFVGVSFILFFALLLVFFSCLYFRLDDAGFVFRLNDIPAPTRRKLKWVALALAVGFLVASPYWFKPIFVHKGVAKNNIQDWAFMDFGHDKFKWLYAIEEFERFFINFEGPYNILKTMLFVAGFAMLLDFRNRSAELNFVRWFFAASLLLSFSYFVTEPLNLGFTPVYVSTFTFGLSAVFVMLVPAAFGSLPVNVKHSLLFFVILLAVAEDVRVYKETFSRGWFGFQPMPLGPVFEGLQEYVFANTDVDDVFLSTNELSFTLNAISGRKLLINRRAHSGIFTDYDQRALDASIILYGNDTLRKLELVRKYDVRYLLWTDYWIKSEYREFGKTPWGDKLFDPIVVLDSPAAIKALSDNAVYHVRQRTWLDPAIKGEYVKKLDLLFISRVNYRSRERPWARDLDPYLIRVWGYTKDGKDVAVLYEFNETKVVGELT